MRSAVFQYVMANPSGISALLIMQSQHNSGGLWSPYQVENARRHMRAAITSILPNEAPEQDAPMNRTLNTDFENVAEGQAIILHPADANMMHREPISAIRRGHDFHATFATVPVAYSIGEVAAFCRGWEPVQPAPSPS